MAITATLLASGGVDLASGGGDTSSTTASITVSAGDLIAIFVHGNIWSSATGVPTGITGPGGLTFTSRASVGPIDGYSWISAWSGVASSGGSGVCTITIPSGGWDGYTYDIVRISGAKTTGTNGADAIRQAGTNVGGEPLTLTFASNMLAGNVGMACGGSYNASLTPQTCTADYTTELADHGVALPDTGSYSMYQALYISADHTDNTPTLDWTGTAASAYGMIAIEWDAVPAGTTVNPTGAAVGIAASAGALGVSDEQGVTGRNANIATSAGSLGVTDSLTLPGNAVSISTQVGVFSFSASVGGAVSGIAAQSGALGLLGVQPITGRSAGIAAQAGTPGANPSQSVTGRSAGIATNAGALGVSDAHTVPGQAAAINALAGSVANAGGPLLGASAGIATNAGALGISDAMAVPGQAAAINAQAGTPGPSNPNALVGQAASINAQAGTVGNAVPHTLTGQGAAINTQVGNIALPGSLLGSALGIAAQAGTLGPASTLGVTGRFLGIVAQAGALGVAESLSLAGSQAGISAQAGTVGASQAGGENPTGQAAGIAAQAGALGVAESLSLLGRSASINLQAGTLGTAAALPGASLGIATAVGTFGLSEALTILGRFVGIAAVAGSINTPGGATDRTLTGQGLGLSTSYGALTWVDYGPPVDWLHVQNKIANNEAVFQYTIAAVWSSKDTNGDRLPASFPYLKRLNAVGYYMTRQVKAAMPLELVAAGFTLKQAQAIITAAENL